MAYNYDGIKQLAKDTGQRVEYLLALDAKNDPFYTGRPAQVAAARWFTDLWQRFGYSTGVHLRRIHYRAVSEDPRIYRPDGKPYENTELCWDYMVEAGKCARYLGLVDPDSFVDRRNPEAKIYTWWGSGEESKPDFYTTSPDLAGYYLPDLPQLRPLPDVLPDPPGIWATGYDDIEQGYHVELWVEKTTMNDVLEPLCKKYRINLVTGAGELSITAVRQFLQRAKDARRPARILYISDFDPAGMGMPISVARKIEFYHRTNGAHGLDVALYPIVLTAAQVEEYDLPRVPVKDTDLRKGHFEAAHGEGQVELDAMEAIYPGRLAEIVTAEIMRYYDPDLSDRAQNQEDNLQAALDWQRQEVLREAAPQLEALKTEYNALQQDFESTRAEFDELICTYAPRLEAHRARLEDITARAGALYEAIERDLEAAPVDPGEYPLPYPDITGDPDGVLYDSDRDYLGQLAVYKAHRAGDDVDHAMEEQP